MSVIEPAKKTDMIVFRNSVTEEEAFMTYI